MAKILTVGEIIKKLEKYPPTHEVWVSLDTNDERDCEYTAGVSKVSEGILPPRVFLWAKVADEDE